jgi:hypothetical protein
VPEFRAECGSAQITQAHLIIYEPNLDYEIPSVQLQHAGVVWISGARRFFSG